MKVRQGLVSNSSSSSFVMFGFQIKDKTFDEKTFYEKITGKEIEDETRKLYDLPDDISKEDLEGYMDDFVSDELNNETKINGRIISIKGHEGEFGKGIKFIGYEPVHISEYETEIFPLELDQEFFNQLADALGLPENKREIQCAAGTEYN